jgi:uroporphyrin-III C-methyltransferase/precorrin-2 dehydrogenase/sirohydrochlorin ferrochelatase
MSRLPIFIKPGQRRVLIFGSGPRAQRKFRFLKEFDLRISILSVSPVGFDTEGFDVIDVPEIKQITDDLFDGVFALVAASESNDENVQLASRAKKNDVLVHISENERDSDFLLPALIDRGPVSVAVSSGGVHPTLTRIVRSQIEALLPARIGKLGDIAAQYRDKVRGIFDKPQNRQEFWEKQLEGRFAELVYVGKENESRKVLEDAIADSATRESQLGEVYLVGAGPGDPDLLSFKALRLMRQADVVLYDRLVSPAILKMVRQDADLIDVGKERSKHTMPQESINELLARLALEGRRVLRLKGGDPFIFGRGGEEIETLAAKGVPFQIVPGITAASGCASYAGIPLTHRDYAQSVRFVTGHLKNNTSNLVWNDLVQNGQTLVFYMGLSALAEIARGLLGHGMAPDTPVAVVSKGTLPDQKVVIAALDQIASEVEKAAVQAPTIIIVGRVVELHKKLSWKAPQ